MHVHDENSDDGTELGTTKGLREPLSSFLRPAGVSEESHRQANCPQPATNNATPIHMRRNHKSLSAHLHQRSAFTEQGRSTSAVVSFRISSDDDGPSAWLVVPCASAFTATETAVAAPSVFRVLLLVLTLFITEAVFDGGVADRFRCFWPLPTRPERVVPSFAASCCRSHPPETTALTTRPDLVGIIPCLACRLQNSGVLLPLMP